MVTTYVRAPIIAIDGVDLDPDQVAYPVTLRTGRNDPAAQPEPAALTFTLPFSAAAGVPRRGQEVTLDIPTSPEIHRFYGLVTATQAVHDEWQTTTASAYQVTCTGWSSTYAGMAVTTPVRVSPNTESAQLTAIKVAFAASGHDILTLPINSAGLDATNMRLPVDLAADAKLLPTLHDLATRTGSLVWEQPDELLITGPSERDGITTGDLIPGHLVPLPIKYEPTELINDITATFGAYDAAAFADDLTPQQAAYVWRTTGTLLSGEIKATTNQLEFHLTDYNTTDYSPTLRAVQAGDLIVVADVTASPDRYVGYMATSNPSISGSSATLAVRQLSGGGWESVPVGGDNCFVWIVNNPPLNGVRVTDTTSQTTYGVRGISIDTGALSQSVAEDRADQVLARWAIEQWIPVIQVRTDLAESQTEWDDVAEYLVHNNTVEIENLWANGGRLSAYNDLFFVEGITHQWNRTNGGRLTHVAQLILAPVDPASAPPVDEGLYPSSSTYPSATTYPGAA